MTTRRALDDTINGDVDTMDHATLRSLHVLSSHIDTIRDQMKRNSDRMITAVIVGNGSLILTAIITSVKLS